MCSSALEAPLKRLDYKNRYKIKLLRLTFYTAGLSFFFFFFVCFHSYHPILPPAASVLRFCFLPPSLRSSIRPLHRSRRRIILFNMVSGRRRLSWQIHYWLALTRTYSLLHRHTQPHTHARKLSRGENRDDWVGGRGAELERTCCAFVVRSVCWKRQLVGCYHIADLVFSVA